jgi:peptidoglycan biosynthesis protein MviN/MurJ (putative lipid II flippase)
MGVLTQMALAFRISSLVVTLLSFAVFSSAFPDLVRAWSVGDLRAYRGFHARALNYGLLLVVPAVALTTCKADQLVSVLFERGAFTELDCKSVAALVRVYSAAAPGLMLLQLWSRAALAQGRSRAIVVGSFLALGVTVALDVVMVRVLGASGLAWAFVCGCWVNAACVGWSVRTTVGLEVGSIVRWVLIAASCITTTSITPTLPTKMGSIVIAGLVAV